MKDVKINENENEKEVLFQKIGHQWYIFTEIRGEIVYSTMPEGMDPRTTELELYDVIEEHIKQVSNQPRYRSKNRNENLAG